MATAMIMERSGISTSRRLSVIKCGGCSEGNSSPCFDFRCLLFIVSSCTGSVRYKKKRFDKISQFGKRPQGDSGDVVDLEQGRIRPGHPLWKMHTSSVRMPDDQHRLSAYFSMSKACHAATRQRVEPVMNRHPFTKTGSV